MDERSTIRLQRRLKKRTPNLHRAKEKAQFECGWKGGDSSRANQVAGRSKSASRDTNYELEKEYAHLPSQRNDGRAVLAVKGSLRRAQPPARP